MSNRNGGPNSYNRFQAMEDAEIFGVELDDGLSNLLRDHAQRLRKSIEYVSVNRSDDDLKSAIVETVAIKKMLDAMTVICQTDDAVTVVKTLMDTLDVFYESLSSQIGAKS